MLSSSDSLEVSTISSGSSGLVSCLGRLRSVVRLGSERGGWIGGCFLGHTMVDFFCFSMGFAMLPCNLIGLDVTLRWTACGR